MRRPLFCLHSLILKSLVLFLPLIFATCCLGQPTEARDGLRAAAEPPKMLPGVGEESAAGDPAATALAPVTSTVEVSASRQSVGSGLEVSYEMTQAEIEESAGTWGDFTRFLQVLPGVVWNTDMSNEVMVRGGHPSENLFVVDGIEIPNINHLAVAGTTGGFTSMIDTAAVESVELKAGNYDPRYSSRLSSLVEVHTLGGAHREGTRQLELGISGAGGLIKRRLGQRGYLLVAMHRSLLNLVTDDIGMNGVPIYTNGMMRWEWAPTERDQLGVLYLSGGDTMRIAPNKCDIFVTLPFRTEYGGQRSTSGVQWRHTHRPNLVSQATGSFSMQGQQIDQQEQSALQDNAGVCTRYPDVTVYGERSQDRAASLSYNVQGQAGRWLLTMGATGRLVARDYAVAQPAGVHSPFHTDPARSDANSFARRFASGETAAFAVATGTLGQRWTVVAGLRQENYALTNAHLLAPQLSVAYRLNGRQSLHASWGRPAQLPAAMNLLSYAQNQQLRPIGVEQFSLGGDLWHSTWLSLGLSAYRKRYWNEPVSSEYPSLMLANMVDTLGQQFVWLPLKSSGRGRSAGVEMLARVRWGQRANFLASASYARTQYAAGDGVMRPGNFDLPVVANLMATWRLPGWVVLSIRETYASGRPYTPFNFKLSEQQSRGIYDLTRVNGLRLPAYNRFDLDLSRNIRLRHGVLNVQAGVENGLNRKNLYGYVWLNSCPLDSGICRVYNGEPIGVVRQMPFFPSGRLRYSF